MVGGLKTGWRGGGPVKFNVSQKLDRRVSMGVWGELANERKGGRSPWEETTNEGGGKGKQGAGQKRDGENQALTGKTLRGTRCD